MILKISICSNRHYIGDWLWGTWSWVHVKAGGESLLWSPGQLAWAMVGQWCRLTSGPVHRWTLNNMTWETWDMLRWLIKSLSLNLTNKLRSSIHPGEVEEALSGLCVLMISVKRMEKCGACVSSPCMTLIPGLQVSPWCRVVSLCPPSMLLGWAPGAGTHDDSDPVKGSNNISLCTHMPKYFAQ